MISDIFGTLMMLGMTFTAITVLILLLASLAFEKTFKAIDERLAKAVRGKTE